MRLTPSSVTLSSSGVTAEPFTVHAALTSTGVELELYSHMKLPTVPARRENAVIDGADIGTKERLSFKMMLWM